MPLHGAGQSPHESFLVMSLSTSAPSSFQPLVRSGKSRAPTPRQFMSGASPFSTDSATAPVVPRSDQSWRIACCGASILTPLLGEQLVELAEPALGLGEPHHEAHHRPDVAAVLLR